MAKFSSIFNIISNDPKIASNLTPELNEKLHKIDSIEETEKRINFLVDILNWINDLSLFIPEIFDLLFEEIESFFQLEDDKFKLVLDTIINWQDWKIGLKLIEKITFITQLQPNKWLLIAEFSFRIGLLCYNLFKGSNYALTLLFFEKTLNFLSKAENEQKILLILSATIWYIGQIEFEKGYSIKASDYQLSSIYYQKNFSDEEFDQFFHSTRVKTRNSLILSSFQAATDFFIASKVAAQSFQIEDSKNYLFHSYSFTNRILKIINNQSDYAILEQIRTFLLQLHSVIDKEGFIPNHSCDSNVLSSKQLESTEFIQYANSHLSYLEDRDKKIIWLAVLDQGGIVLFEYDFEENCLSSKNTLYSSFIHVISKWGQVEFESGPAKELNFLGNSFIIESSETIEVIAVVSKPSVEFHFAIKNFANKFNATFKNILNNNWNGSVKIFEEKGLEFIKNLKENLLK